MSPFRRRYVAFLRAINVGGRVVKMAALKRIDERGNELLVVRGLNELMPGRAMS